MSRHIPPDNQAESSFDKRDQSADTAEDFILIHNTTDGYASSSQTDSTATVTADKAAATAPVPTREHVLYHVHRDYNGTTEPLTEQAIAALNNDFHNGSYNGNIGDWVSGRSQFPPSDPVDLSLSLKLVRNPRTLTDSTVGSSWTIVSSSTPSDSQTAHVAEDICAAGLQFADVPALTMGPGLLDEDFI